MEGTTEPVSRAAVETFAIAGICRFPVSVMTAVTSNSWWPQPTLRGRYRKLLVQLKLPHSFAPESPRITLCVTVAHLRGIPLPFRESAAFVLLEFNSPANSAA